MKKKSNYKNVYVTNFNKLSDKHLILIALKSYRAYIIDKYSEQLFIDDLEIERLNDLNTRLHHLITKYEKKLKWYTK